MCVQGKHLGAKEAYEQLVECTDLPPLLKSNSLRQLGTANYAIVLFALSAFCAEVIIEKIILYNVQK